MKNLEKYESSLFAAIAAYNGEMMDRSENGIGGLPFEDWVEEDTDTTARLIAEEKKRKEEIAAALANEKEAIRKGMEELKAHYKANGYDEAEKLLDEIFRLNPDYDLYGKHDSACNCFHTGMWEIICEDFSTVWDVYSYVKEGGGYAHEWSNPVEWLESQKGLVGYIKPFVDEAKEIIKRLKTEGGQKA